jgi:uncharacterized membrane protein
MSWMKVFGFGWDRRPAGCFRTGGTPVPPDGNSQTCMRVQPEKGATMPDSETVGVIRTVIEWAALAIENLGAVVIVAGVLKVAITRGTVRYLFQLDKPGAFESYKHQMGRSLLLGLEFLVAGDVVRTVALEPTLVNVAVLGLLVFIRTFLSWSLAVEIEGRWPWQARAGGGAPQGSAGASPRPSEQGVHADSGDGRR